MTKNMPRYDAYILDDNGLGSIPNTECTRVLAGEAWGEGEQIVLQLSTLNKRGVVYLVKRA